MDTSADHLKASIVTGLPSYSYFQDCFILDTGAAGFFVWIGRGSTKAEKSAAMDRANKFMAQKGLPAWTRVRSALAVSGIAVQTMTECH